jgi:hypothetical protein
MKNKIYVIIGRYEDKFGGIEFLLHRRKISLNQKGIKNKYLIGPAKASTIVIWTTKITKKTSEASKVSHFECNLQKS